MNGEFVILEHGGYGPMHWDLMLADGPALATWQCPVNPAELADGEAMTCRKLPDHRREYLTYEGPVSRGRGQVRRVAEGRYERISAEENSWIVHLDGKGISGRFRLQPAAGEDWTFTRESKTEHE
jgi:hypothetical protein